MVMPHRMPESCRLPVGALYGLGRSASSFVVLTARLAGGVDLLADFPLDGLERIDRWGDETATAKG